MATATRVSVAEICAAAKRASRDAGDARLGRQGRRARGDRRRADRAHARDSRGQRPRPRGGPRGGLTAALLDRLALDERRIAAIAAGARKIAALPDPVGEVIDGFRLPNGLDVRKVRVPLGVVAVVYEARPNVTIDAAALCLKSGNAIVLRGSSSAAHSNAVLAGVAAEAAVAAGLPDGSLSLIAGGDRDELAELATQTGVVDLIIPRGGEGLKAALKGVATVPVIYRRLRQLPRLRRSQRRPRRRRRRSWSTRRSSGPASATRPRRCSSTPTSPTSSCRACCARCTTPASRCTATSGRARRPPTRRSDARHRRGLGHRVPGARDGGRGRRRRRGRDRAHQPLTAAATRRRS